MTIPLLRPSVSQAEIDAVTEVLKSGWWGQGPVVERFEKELAERYGYEHCVTTNSATAALHLALLTSGVGPGDEVVLPALTFISTALAVTYCGATPVFADIDPVTLCMDWWDASTKYTPRTRLFLPVDYAGYPAGADGTPWFIVQDAAHSCGGVGYGQNVCLSFHPVKNLATGDGGAILTNDAKQARRLRALRWCGIDKSTWDRSKTRYGWDYQVAEIGYKLHWNDVQAAIGLVQLHRLDEMNAERHRLAKRYTALLEDCDLTLPVDIAHHTWHLYVIRVDAMRRERLIDALKENDISAGVHYKPLTHYPMYRQDTPPVTQREWRRLVTLPLYVGLTDAEQDRIVEIVRRECGG